MRTQTIDSSSEGGELCVQHKANRMVSSKWEEVQSKRVPRPLGAHTQRQKNALFLIQFQLPRAWFGKHQ